MEFVWLLISKMKKLSYLLIFFLSSCSLQEMQENSLPVVDRQEVKTLGDSRTGRFVEVRTGMYYF